MKNQMLQIWISDLGPCYWVYPFKLHHNHKYIYVNTHTQVPIYIKTLLYLHKERFSLKSGKAREREGTSQSIRKIIKIWFSKKERKKELTSSLRLSPIIITSFGRTSQAEQICSSGPGSGLYGRNSLLSAGPNVNCSHTKITKDIKLQHSLGISTFFFDKSHWVYLLKRKSKKDTPFQSMHARGKRERERESLNGQIKLSTVFISLTLINKIK